MKLIKTKNQIVSLENVREVLIRHEEHQRTYAGEKYIVYTSTITINYTDDKSTYICINQKSELTEAIKIFDEIFEILSE